MTASLFKVAGVSTFKDGTKVRFANDLTRVKILVKGGHTDIELMELPTSMTKGEVCKHLLTTSLMTNPVFKQAIEDADEKYNGVKTVAVAKTARVSKTTVIKTKAPAKTVAKVGTKVPATTKPAPKKTTVTA